MSRSSDRRLAIQRGHELPAAGQNPPPLAPHEARDLALRQAVERLTGGYLKFAQAAAESIREKDYERFGFLDPEAYFTERIGFSYRTLRRLLSVVEGIDRLPAGEQPEAEQLLARLGTHKAAAIAPVLGREGEDWRKWAAFAEKASEEGVQAAVSDAMGARPRGKPSDPGERWYAFVLNNLPPDAVEEVQEVFEIGRKLGMTNPIAVFLAMIREVKVEWSNALESRSRHNTQ